MARDVERDWAREHPEPMASFTEELLTLWNFPVGVATLGPAHRQAIDRFTAVELGLSAGASSCEFGVNGHASATGTEAGNDRLADARAQEVAAYLALKGARHVTATGSGSTARVDAAATGLAHARNRRVEVFKWLPAPPSKKVPLDLDPPEGDGIPPQAKGDGPDLSDTIEIPVDTPPVPLRFSAVVADVRLQGTLIVTLKSGTGDAGLKAAFKGRGLNAKIEGRVMEGIKGIVSLEPGGGTQPAKLKAGIVLDDLAGAPEVGWQVSANPLKPVYITYTLNEVQLADAEIAEGVKVSVRFKGKVNLDLGPSEALLARMAPYAAPTAAVGGVLVAAAVINGGTALLAEAARAEGLRYAELLARRDGAAARVALEVLGTDALPQAKQRELDWSKMEAGTRAAFRAGSKEVNDLLVGLGPKGRDERAKQWTAAYGAGAGVGDYPDVRERVFQALGGYLRAGEGSPKSVAEL